MLLVAFQSCAGALCQHRIYERQYSHWRIAPDHPKRAATRRNTVLGAVMSPRAPLIIYKFTIDASLYAVDSFPEKPRSRRSFWAKDGGTSSRRSGLVAGGPDRRRGSAGGDVFDGIVPASARCSTALTLALNGSPWPVVMLIIAVTPAVPGPRVAIFTVAAMAYIALLGYWAHRDGDGRAGGAAVLLCVIIGIPRASGSANRAAPTAWPSRCST